MSALYHEVHGTAGTRDLVLLHGWSLNLRVWDPVVRALSPYYRLITVDLPGHGGSDWDPKAASPAAQAWRVHETLESITERYTLIGWSLGGQVALDLAAALPAHIEALGLICTTPRFLTAPGWRCGTARTSGWSPQPDWRSRAGLPIPNPPAYRSRRFNLAPNAHRSRLGNGRS